MKIRLLPGSNIKLILVEFLLPGMLSENREKFKKIEIKTGEFFSKLGPTPNQYTLISLFFAILAFYFLIKNPSTAKGGDERMFIDIDLILALIFFLLATLLDFIDGAVARFTQKATKKGAYLDTISDRYIEGIILLGFLFLPLADFLLPAKVWIFLALFGSFLTTYSKAAAKEKEMVTEELKKGLLGRGERVILIFLAMLLGIFNLSFVIYPIIILAIFSNI
ncbi:CDP-alcohol phosphatidyltransferase family protein, partial [bacterium]|nr:CDP-alcohol phosphatidyltransferase family protein [bacterium]